MFNPDDLEFPKLKRAEADKMPRIPFIAQEKLDGESLMLAVGHAYGRRISEVSGHRENKWDIMPPWVQESARAVDGLLVHGELHVRGGTSSDVKTALVEGRETGWSGDLCRRLYFTAHTAVGRTGDAREHAWYLGSRGFQVPQMVDYKDFGPLAALQLAHDAKTPILNTDKASYTTLLNIARHEGLEGFVLKEVGPDRRGWWKLKVTWTYDVVVTGWKPGTGMHYGDVGALIVGVFGDDKDNPVEVASVGGMTEAERKWMSDHRDSLRGRVCEVEANGTASRGRLHHPRFLRWREDKNAHDCRIDQLRRS